VARWSAAFAVFGGTFLNQKPLATDI
jgi:hypothetical protein